MTVFGADGEVADADVDVPLTDEEVFGETSTDVATVEQKVDPETEIAVRDEVKAVALQEQWPHDYLKFEGDQLEIRLPTEQALSAFSISVSKYMPAEVQNDMVGLFISKHLSPESYTHVLARMMDPDEPNYTNKTIGQLMGAVSRAALAQRKAEKDAEKADAA